MFHLTTQSTHFIYGYMASDHSDSEKGNPLPPHRLLFPINSNGFYMHHPTDRIAHTTAFVTPVVDNWLEREIAQWVLPMKDRSDDPSHHERTLLRRIMYEVVYSVKYISSFSNNPSLHTMSNVFCVYCFVNCKNCG